VKRSARKRALERRASGQCGVTRRAGQGFSGELRSKQANAPRGRASQKPTTECDLVSLRAGAEIGAD
jgi:hypothetical protein